MKLGIARITIGTILILLQVLSWIGNALNGGFAAVPFSLNPYVLGCLFGIVFSSALPLYMTFVSEKKVQINKKAEGKAL